VIVALVRVALFQVDDTMTVDVSSCIVKAKVQRRFLNRFNLNTTSMSEGGKTQQHNSMLLSQEAELTTGVSEVCVCCNLFVL
jgi:hypothetical protein